MARRQVAVDGMIGNCTRGWIRLAAKTLPVLPGKIYDQKTLDLLFGTCWITYFISYLGRLNYAASMVEIGADMNYATSMLGLIATIMFVCYGAGQLIGGIIGDYLPPRVMALCGVAISALCNLAAGLSGSYLLLAVVWGVNGLAQSLIWSPILRLFSMYMPEQALYKACVNIQSSCAVGTCLTYLLTAGIVALSGWRVIFLFSGILLAAAAVWWQIAIRRVERYDEQHGKQTASQTAAPEETAAKPANLWKLMLTSGALGTLLPIVAMGMLKDGVVTWMPEYASGNFGTSSAFSIFITAFLPLVNLCGVYIITPLRKKMPNEQSIAVLMFGVGGAAIAALMLAGSKSLLLTVVLFAIVTSCTTGCNTALISLMPTAFVRYGRTSASVGILNACCYVGSALSGYGIGLLAEKGGWSSVQILWLVCCAASVLICLALAPVWKRFKEQK